MTVEELLGPIGLTVAAVIAVAALWREHLRTDAERARQSDAWMARSIATDERLDRLADLLQQLLGVKEQP